MPKPWVRRLITLVSVVAVLGAGYVAFIFRQDIIDWWKLSIYKPSAEVVSLADATTMAGRGRDLFYVSDPKINERDEFNINCTDTGEESLVLGCYRAQQIFLYNVTDSRLNGVKEVTAAHEMLHAAYERLNTADRSYVDTLLQTQLTLIKDDRLAGLIALYNKEEPGHLLNEMHSILGTEFRNLTPDLEAYYKQYFSDRAKVVAYSEAYETTFTASKNRITTYDERLADLQKQIDAGSSKLDQQKASLEAQAANLDSLRGSDTAAYNKAVPPYNSNVRAFNTLVAQTKKLVNDYNALVEKRNSEVAAQNDLYQNLDSNYQPVSTN